MQQRKVPKAGQPGRRFVRIAKAFPAAMERGMPSILHTSSLAGMPTRPTTDLVPRPLVFSQAGLVDAEDFVKQAGRRRIGLDLALLEDLHRCRLLVPLYRVRAGRPRPAEAVAGLDDDHEATGYLLDRRVAVPASGGRLADPGPARFSPWPRDDPKSLQPRAEDRRGNTSLLYSPYQLLALHGLSQLIARHATVWRGPHSARRLDPGLEMVAGTPSDLASWRALAVLLHAVDTRYLPVLRRVVSHPKGWSSYASSFEPAKELAWLGTTVDDVREASEMLNSLGRNLDVIGDFFDLVRRANPESWESLEGDALMALDFGVAAGVLSLFADHVEGKDLRPARLFGPARSWPPLSQQGLRQRAGSLDHALTQLGLSPYPALVLTVEGQTEQRLVPRVFELLGRPLDDESWVRLECFGGVDKKKHLELVALYVGRPLLGDDYGIFTMVDRPVTRLMVAVDPEKEWATEEDREHRREVLLRKVLEAVEKRLRPDLASAGARLVTVRAWGALPFEFAHFSDQELAVGLIAMAGAGPACGKATLVERLEAERKRHKPGGRGSKVGGSIANIDGVFRRCWPGQDSETIKVKFAEAMWPVLEAKIRASLADPGTFEPPVLRLVKEAIELASMPKRVNIALRRSPDPSGGGR